MIRSTPQPFFLGDGAFASPRKVVTNGGIRQVIGELGGLGMLQSC